MNKESHFGVLYQKIHMEWCKNESTQDIAGDIVGRLQNTTVPFQLIRVFLFWVFIPFVIFNTLHFSYLCVNLSKSYENKSKIIKLLTVNRNIVSKKPSKIILFQREINNLLNDESLYTLMLFQMASCWSDLVNEFYLPFLFGKSLFWYYTHIVHLICGR